MIGVLCIKYFIYVRDVGQCSVHYSGLSICFNYLMYLEGAFVG